LHFSVSGNAIKNVIAENPRWKYFFYRTANGAEVDLVLVKGTSSIAVEFKASMAPKTGKGLWSALEDIQPESTWIVIPEGDQYTIKEGVTVIPLEQFLSADILD
jgi:predicted AAA+ superfamily ATPase